ncbi:hypothetical protein GCM10009039_18310 [Halocalculus aciditolerans]|uniref:Uncharacterized protein n=2 Tax=Halocalculus aciditolerans TaxID=1383812 RepID=A0A830FC25_9EURY|nr:hypothetical protein [Halocalculus aciditolerans]GGL60387.1 hypothetical protein GCM10009039_18310 [Halocalculus aciditolerans]
MRHSVLGTIRGMGVRANPAFAVGVVAVPVAALLAAALAGTLQQLTYVHVMAGVLWTGIDLFMALVLGPVLGGLDGRARAAVFERFTPKLFFLMPTLAVVTTFGGITLALDLGVFPHAMPWLALFTAAATTLPLLSIGYQFDAFTDRRWLAFFAIAVLGSGSFLYTTLGAFAWTSPLMLIILADIALLTILGNGTLMPGEVRIYYQITSDDPDTDLIGRIGLRNAKLSGVQGVLQLVIIAAMVYLRWGGLPL